MHDLLIRDAEIHDGTGGPPVRGHLWTRGGRIAGIGASPPRACEVVEADGLALMPGIVDLHTHYDAQVTWDATCSPSPGLGVTTCVWLGGDRPHAGEAVLLTHARYPQEAMAY